MHGKCCIAGPAAVGAAIAWPRTLTGGYPVEITTYKIRDKGKGRHDRYTIQVYIEHPDVGPAGTPGRGPYCIAWIPCNARNLDSAKAELAARNIAPA